MKTKLNELHSALYIPVIIGLIILVAALSLCWFSFGYWLITIILDYFFSYILPFSWSYALGGWLISLIVGTFILPFKVNIKYE